MHINVRSKRFKMLATFVAATSLIVYSSISCCLASQSALDQRSATALPLAQSCTIRFSLESEYMGFKVPCLVYLPRGYRATVNYPVWYGLHGNSSSETMWLQTAGIGAKADAMAEQDKIDPLIMVFPLVRYDSAKTIQEDMKDGVRSENLSEQFIYKELVPYIDAHYSTIATPDGRYIGGFSMGGLFALQIAIHHPDLFGKVGGYSPALAYNDFSNGRFETWLNNGNVTQAATDIPHYAKSMELDKIRVYIDYGSDGDPFAEGVQSLYKALLEHGTHAELHAHSGGHSLQADKLEAYLLFYCGK